MLLDIQRLSKYKMYKVIKLLNYLAGKICIHNTLYIFNIKS